MGIFIYLHNVRVMYGEEVYKNLLANIIDFWYAEDPDVTKQCAFNFKNM